MVLVFYDWQVVSELLGRLDTKQRKQRHLAGEKATSNGVRAALWYRLDLDVRQTMSREMPARGVSQRLSPERQADYKIGL